MGSVIKKYLDLKCELEKLEKSIDFVYVTFSDDTEHSQMVEKTQKDFLYALGFALVDEDSKVGNSRAIKFAAPEKMEPGIVHNLRCKLNLIQRDIIAGEFTNLQTYLDEF